ncbi:MAG: HD domain-containing protein [Bacteroidetes bacterium]|nr:MAG: HD domain-containing protein [Bacteroidota bacterium]
MSELSRNKLKIFNDPVYGFVNIPDVELFDVLEHPYFQRLRRIKQLGLSHLVYPGALHTRFHHALGAMYLMSQALEVLKAKGHIITREESKAALFAILLHDIGHGPFSHALEHTLVEGLDHEELSFLFMERLRYMQPEGIGMAMEIFKNKYPKKYLHQLVSGQLDMDRLDYLNRDSFFTGVSEGVVSYDRIIKTLNVADDRLVTDEKGIYSLEKFIIARRLMYWQVYLHKTVISAERLLITILQRARELASNGQDLFATPPFKKFLYNSWSLQDFHLDQGLLEDFALLDDFDVFTSIKVWTSHPDKVLSDLCTRLVARKLLKIEIQKDKFDSQWVEDIREKTAHLLKISQEEVKYYVLLGHTENNAYDPGVGNIWIMQKNGEISDMAEVSDQLNIRVLSNPVKKYYICYPKEVWDLLSK